MCFIFFSWRVEERSLRKQLMEMGGEQGGMMPVETREAGRDKCDLKMQSGQGQTLDTRSSTINSDSMTHALKWGSERE